MSQQLMTSQSIAFRWINSQCFEIKLPNGKTILTDPCYDFPENPNSPIPDLFRLRGFHTEDIEACDYVILNHTHGDHMSNLEEVVKRFHPIVICHTGVALEIAETCDDLELTSLCPVDYDGTYEFGGFRMQTFHGMHKPQLFTWKRCMDIGDDISQQPKLNRLHTMGSFFNMNFMLTLENGFRIAFVGGLDDGMSERLRTLRPNIALRNKLTNDMDVDVVANDWYSFMQASYAQYVLPMHYEVWENQNPGFSVQTFARANELADKTGLPCRILPLERTQWYTLQLGWCTR